MPKYLDKIHFIIIGKYIPLCNKKGFRSAKVSPVWSHVTCKNCLRKRK